MLTDIVLAVLFATVVVFIVANRGVLVRKMVLGRCGRGSDPNHGPTDEVIAFGPPCEYEGKTYSHSYIKITCKCGKKFLGLVGGRKLRPWSKKWEKMCNEGAKPAVNPKVAEILRKHKIDV